MNVNGKSCCRQYWSFEFVAFLCKCYVVHAPCGLHSCKNRHAPFPGRMLYTSTKPGLVSVLYLSMCYAKLLLIMAPFCVSLVFVAM